jgi:hypothetical protein
VGVVWLVLANGAGDNFVIENTSEATARAEAGQQHAAVAAVVLAALGGLVPLLGSRFPRAAVGLVVGSGLVVLLTSGSGIVLVTGLLSAVPVGAGVLLALVPAGSATDQ